MGHFDVAVVGAGPAGSSAAIHLARKGYSVALLDKEPFPREKLCGDFLNPINWPLLRELEVDREVLARPHEKVMTFLFTSFSGDEAEVPLPGSEDGTLFGLGVRRFDLDYVLLKKSESEGATHFQECKLTDLKREAQSWLLRFDRAGMIEGLRARVLIGADGRNSWVAHRLGLADLGTMRGRSVGFQFRLKGSNRDTGKIEIHLFPGGYAGIVGLGGGTVNLCLAIERDRLLDGRPEEFLLDTCLPRNSRLGEILRGPRVSEMRSTYPVYFPPRRAYGEGALLVGDAARVNEPVTGEGIYFALKSGALAARTIDQAFQKRDFSAHQLSSYERECRSGFRFRRGISALIRWLIYRPALVSSLIRCSGRRRGLLDFLVHTICQPEAVR
jgi:geranylgeranyl reductase family protein